MEEYSEQQELQRLYALKEKGLININPTSPYYKKKNKIGRNDPCPCESGKKYKKCCLNKE